MKSVENLKNRIFLRKIVLSVTIGMTIMITVLSVILYFFIENLVLQIQNESYRNLMNQVQYNISFVGQTIKNTCEQLYLNNDVKYIMNLGSSESDFEESMIKMNMVWKSVKDSNPFIHSIFIYNNNTRQFYSTFKGMLFQDTGLLEYLKNKESITRMTPVFRKIRDNSKVFGTTESVMSYFIYDTYDKKSGMKNGIVVNVKLQWLLDNLNEVNLNQTLKSTRLIIMDNTGKFVDENSNEQLLKCIKDSYNNYKMKNRNEKQDCSFTMNFNGEKYFVSYYHLDNLGVTAFNLMCYKELKEYVLKLQRVMIIVFGIFLFLAIIESLIISKRIYNPFGSMLAHIRSQSVKNLGNMDDSDGEISFLSTIYDRNAKMIETYRSENSSNSSIIKTYLLRNLLTNGLSKGRDETVKILQNNGVTIETDTKYAVGIVKIDNYEKLMKSCKSKDIDLIKFAILNIGCEIIGSQYINEGLDMGNDSIFLIICIKDQEKFNETFHGMIGELQSVLMKYYDISVTAAVSIIVDSLNDLPKAYAEVSEYAYYRYVFGRGAVIFYEQIVGREEGESLQYLDKVDKKLYESMMTGNFQKVEQFLHDYFNHLSKMSYEGIIVSEFRLLNTMKQAITELNRNRVDTVNINFHELYSLPFHVETMEDFFNELIELLQSILNKDKAKIVESRHSMLIDAVSAIINEKYNESGLCLDEIALSLNISSRQLSRIFKSGTGSTIPEQINEVRLLRAGKLLKCTEMSVSEVAINVGIESETYFYTMFKRKYGTTPKEYSVIKSLKKE